MSGVGNMRAIGFCVLLVSETLACSGVEAKDMLPVSGTQAAVLGIETALLERQPATGQLFPARVVIPARQIRLVTAQLAGRIESIAVRPDDAVRAGQVVAELQSPALARAQAEFLQAWNQERLLRKTLEREQSLSPSFVPQKQLLATTNEHAQALAIVAERRHGLLHFGMSDRAIEALCATQSVDSKLTITAPMDGVALEVSAVPGQTVEAMAPLVKLAQLSPLWIEIQVPAAQASKFAVGDQVEVADHAAAGQVLSIGATVDPMTQSLTVRAGIAGPGRALRPGQAVEAQIRSGPVADGEWRVRTSAVVRRGKDAVVFVETQEGYRPTPVVTHDEFPEFITVTGPFRGDERVVVRGLAALKGAWQGLGGIQ